MESGTSAPVGFEQLSPQAQRRAVTACRRLLAPPHGDGEELAAAVTWALSTRLGAEAYGWQVTVWCPQRARPLQVTGVLHRRNAPRLPWHGRLQRVLLAPSAIRVQPRGCPQAARSRSTHMRTAVENVLAAAFAAGRELAATWHVLDWIAAQRPVFTPDGRLYHLCEHPDAGVPSPAA